MQVQVHAYTQERRVWAQQLNKIIDETQSVREQERDTWNGHNVFRQVVVLGSEC